MSTRPSPDRTPQPGVVSVIIVNYRGADDTIVCAQALESTLDWPSEKLDIVIVDNASGDDSVERIRAALPRATLIPSATNSGFAGGCNLGASHAAGEYLALLNNDARPHRDWIRAAVAEFERDPEVAAVASKVLDWDGKLVDYVDGSLTWFGMGYKREVEKPDSADYNTPKDVLFGTGAAMFVRAETFREVGGFDERFFMFYEDVDLGWRLNILGHRFRYVPTSLAFHRHHATMRKFGNFREAYLLERNALLSMYKNLGDEALARALPAALALAVRRAIAGSGTDATILDLQRHPSGDAEASVEVSKMALTGPLAIDYFVEQLPSLTATRSELQETRRRSDRDVLRLFREPMEPAYGYPSYLEAHRSLVEAFGVAEVFAARHRILVVTGEPLKERMAGPAIRAWEVARALSEDHEVRLISTVGVEVVSERFGVEYAGGSGLREPTDWADVIVFQGFLLSQAPWLIDSDKIIVADIYDPMHLEQLEQARDLGTEGRAFAVAETTRVLNEQLRRADYLVCASEKQRDFWLGQLAGQGRVNTLTYDEDSALGSLLGIVPFGIPDTPPEQRRHGIRGSTPGISSEDKVVIWAGGVYNWFDPLTLIRAVATLAGRHPDVRLYFMGLKHPNPGVPAMRMASDARDLAAELGLTDRHVFFNEGWVPYSDRADYLLDADVGVSTHFEHIETAFSFRTRILDYLWASLPIVSTSGDTFAELIERNRLGRTVPPSDVAALAEALEALLYDPEAASETRARVRSFAESYRWSRVLEPLVEFCRAPRRAPDLAASLGAAHVAARPPRRSRPRLREDVELARRYLAAGGPRELARRVSGRLGRIVDR